MRAREGDLIETGDKVIFDVKGLVHPPHKIVAFPRYIPNPEGTRGRRGELYSKIYNLAERFTYLQMKTPQLIVADPVFGEKLCEVPAEAVTRRYDPIKKLRALRSRSNLQPLEQKAVMLAEELKEAAGIPWRSLGVSGSVMAGLFTLQSDIDPIVYGSANCRKAYAALQTLLKTKTSRFKPYTKAELQTLFDFRSKDTCMSFEDFERVEARKAFQGKYDGTDYFVRFVKDYDEIGGRYGDVCYENAGYVKICARVVDDSEALFTPCTYTLENMQVLSGGSYAINEIVSFRGRFCLQARPGEVVTAQGKVERVTDKGSGLVHYRIIIGNGPADYMVLLKA